MSRRPLRLPWARPTGLETVDVFFRDVTRYLRELASTALSVFTRTEDGLVPAPGDQGDVPDDHYLGADARWHAPPTGGSLADGDYTDITVSGAGTVLTIDPDTVTHAKYQNIATDRVLGRDTAGSGDPEELTVGGGLEFTGTGGLQRSALTGDVTAGAGSGATTITDNAVTNLKLADMASPRFKGRITAGSGDPEDLTGTQATTLLDVFTSALKGLAPASGGGTANYLRADGTWASPAAGSGAAVRATSVTVPYGSTQFTTNITDAAVSPGMLLVIGWGAVSDTDENGPTADDVSFSAVAGSGVVTVTVASNGPIGGLFKLNYAVA